MNNLTEKKKLKRKNFVSTAEVHRVREKKIDFLNFHNTCANTTCHHKVCNLCFIFEDKET